MKVLFATSNRHKFSEAETILNSFGIKISHECVSPPEIQADDCAQVAESSAREIFALLNKPVFVEDSGLFVRALNGLPGPFSSWFDKKIGCQGVLKLLKGARDRRAEFVSAVAFMDQRGLRVFQGRVPGRIALRQRGKAGFGFDPIFIPQGSSRTFAEDAALKNRVSHRAKSLEKLAKWLKKRRECKTEKS